MDKVLILTDGKRSIWVNALTGNPILDEDGNAVTAVIDPKQIEASKTLPETARKIVDLLETADHSLSETNDQFKPL